MSPLKGAQLGRAPCRSGASTLSVLNRIYGTKHLANLPLLLSAARRGRRRPYSVPSHKCNGIRTPLHPLRLRSAPSKYSKSTTSVARLAGAAHRRSRCVTAFMRRNTTHWRHTRPGGRASRSSRPPGAVSPRCPPASGGGNAPVASGTR